MLDIISTAPDDEGIVWYRKASTNETLGYVKGDEIYVIDEDGNATFLERYDGSIDVRRSLYIKKAMLGARKTMNTTALIGFLAAKLALYEPNSSTVKKALEYLDARS
jgi:hypothetical protein